MALNMLTTAQVAAKLGVKPQTIYAYVSRGVLTRTLTEDGRESRFDPAEVEALLERSRPRSGAKPAGRVTVSIHSAITELARDGLRYRGHRVAELCATADFEQVAHLLWTGELPGVVRFRQQALPAPVLAALRGVSPWASPIERFMVALTVGACVVPPLLSGAAGPEAGEQILDLLVQSLPLLGDAQPRKAAQGRLAERLWPRLSHQPATRPKTKLLGTALCLLADHELATSTLAVRVAASTRPDLHAVLLAGLSTASGVLHGRAASNVHRTLSEGARSGHPERALRELAAASGEGATPGFGHPVYEHGDERCGILLAALQRLRMARRRREVWERALAAGREATGQEPNVDFALGALTYCTGMAPEAASAIFALARSAGWIAHALEEFEQPPLRYRGRALYVGA